MNPTSSYENFHIFFILPTFSCPFFKLYIVFLQARHENSTQEFRFLITSYNQLLFFFFFLASQRESEILLKLEGMKNCSLVKCGFSCHVRLAVGWDQCLWQFMGVIFLTVCPILSCIVANEQKEVRKRCIGPNNPVDLNRHCSWRYDLVSVWFNNIVLKLFLLKWLEFYLKTWYIFIIPLQCFLNHPFFPIPIANTQIHILLPYDWIIRIFFSLASISLFLPPLYSFYILLLY